MESSKAKSGKTMQLLRDVVRGNPGSVDALMTELYGELRTLAQHYLASESPGHTLQATALVNEAYIRLIDQSQVEWQGRSHFFAVGAQAMRRILVDHARRKGRIKRGKGCERVDLDTLRIVSPQRSDDVLAIDEAICELEERDPRQAQIVEMRFFGGMTVEEVAEALGISRRTVESEWTIIRAWLRRRLGDETES
jgi:RNA polymerase sigma factor (TIGR02999 family)